jgi:hypothetical protein
MKISETRLADQTVSQPVEQSQERGHGLYRAEFFATPLAERPYDTMTRYADSLVSAITFIRAIIPTLSPCPAAWDLRDAAGRIVYRRETTLGKYDMRARTRHA